MKRSMQLLLVAGIMISLIGCAAFRVSVKEQDPEKGGPLSAKYDQRDLISWTDEMTQLILSHPFPVPTEQRPMLAVLGIQNRTKTHLDTQSLADTIGMKMLDSGKVRLVNTTQRDALMKEQGYQIANVTPEGRVQIGKQLGARYMLTGSIVEIETTSGRQVRVSKKQDVFYQLTMEVTDLQSGEILLIKQVTRMRRASKPIIGW